MDISETIIAVRKALLAAEDAHAKELLAVQGVADVTPPEEGASRTLKLAERAVVEESARATASNVAHLTVALNLLVDASLHLGMVSNG